MFKKKIKVENVAGVVGNEMNINGTLKCAGPITIYGYVVADGIDKLGVFGTQVTVAKNGAVQGCIECEGIVVEGVVGGNIKCSGHVYVVEGGVVEGSISCSSIEMFGRVNGEVVFRREDKEENVYD